MAKNFPYFKFVATEWLTGNIAFEDYELQGIFINICALYWHREANITIEEIKKRFKTNRVDELIGDFITINKDNTILIKFLDEQLIEVNYISKVNSENGKKGALVKQNKATAKRPLSEPLAKTSKEDKEEDKEKEKEEGKGEVPYRKFKHLTLSIENFNKLNTTYPKKQIDKILDAIENYAKNKNYTSLYLTAKKWLDKEGVAPEKLTEKYSNQVLRAAAMYWRSDRIVIKDFDKNDIPQLETLIKEGAI